MKEFYDGKIRPDNTQGKFHWENDELRRVCFNCGHSFGYHRGYKCPDASEKEDYET